jgi:hypothetical protein
VNPIDSTSTRWRHRESGELLVAIAVKRNDEASMVLAVHARLAPHPLDWVPESAFLREYEPVGHRRGER